MESGNVKRFTPQGYGFIQPQSGGQDVYVHFSGVERPYHAQRGPARRVRIVSIRGKSSTEKLKVE
jgi:CspA family cold shock protein